MESDSKYKFFSKKLEELKKIDQYRKLNTVNSRQGKYIFFNDKKMLNFSSNDYLGLASNQNLQKEFYETISGNEADFNLSSSSSRLLTGNNILYNKLENKIEEIYGKCALVFNSGYHANTGIISAIAGKGDIIFSDKLNHASIIDGILLSGAEHERYMHDDYENLERKLNEKRNKFKNAFIVSESIFSMEGDCADISKLVNLKEKYNAFLIIDEAHSVGACGEKGLGKCEEKNLLNETDIIIGTFGKALGSLGAFCVCDKIIKDFLINKTRPFIFTTALPPVILNWNIFILNKLAGFNYRRDKLKEISIFLTDELKKINIISSGTSHIIPVITGSNEKAAKLSDHLRNKNLLLFPIRPPTVPEKSSRVRISLNAEINHDEIKLLIDAVKDFYN